MLTLACGKFRFNDMDLGTVGGLPRLMDMGQCNDAYSAIKVAVALADAFGCGVNDLPLTLVLSWYEQKAVCILLTLLHLGLTNIYLGPTLPAFLSPHVLAYLVEHFHIHPISTPDRIYKQFFTKRKKKGFLCQTTCLWRWSATIGAIRSKFSILPKCTPMPGGLGSRNTCRPMGSTFWKRRPWCTISGLKRAFSVWRFVRPPPGRAGARHRPGYAAKLGYAPDVIDRVCYLVGHHHTYGQVDGLDYRILIEADFLVNLYEDSCSHEAIRHAYETMFRTASGKALCRAMFRLEDEKEEETHV